MIGLNEVDPQHYRDGDGKPWNGKLSACENDARDMASLAEGLRFGVCPHGVAEPEGRSLRFLRR